MKSKTPTYTQFSFLLNIHLAKKMCQLTGLWLGIKRSENWGLKRWGPKADIMAMCHMKRKGPH